MRRLAIALAVMLPVIASAQITVNRTGTEKKTIIAIGDNCAPFDSRQKKAAINLVETGEVKAFVLTIESTNKSDDPYNLALGQTVESAIETIRGLASLFDSAVGDAFDFDTPDIEGVETYSHHSVIMTDAYGETTGTKPKGMRFKESGRAGHIFLTKRCVDGMEKDFKNGVKVRRIKL